MMARITAFTSKIYTPILTPASSLLNLRIQQLVEFATKWEPDLQFYGKIPVVQWGAAFLRAPLAVGEMTLASVASLASSISYGAAKLLKDSAAMADHLAEIYGGLDLFKNGALNLGRAVVELFPFVQSPILIAWDSIPAGTIRAFLPSVG